MRMDERIAFRCDRELSAKLDEYASAHGLDRGGAARMLLGKALFAENEGTYTSAVAEVVRTELAAWTARAGIDWREMRAMKDAVLASLWLQLFDAAECGGGDMEYWRERAMAGAPRAVSGPLEE